MLKIVTEWPSDQVIEWLSDWVTEWPSDQVTKWPSDQVTGWQEASQTIDRIVYFTYISTCNRDMNIFRQNLFLAFFTLSDVLYHMAKAE